MRPPAKAWVGNSRLFTANIRFSFKSVIWQLYWQSSAKPRVIPSKALPQLSRIIQLHPKASASKQPKTILFQSKQLYRNVFSPVCLCETVKMVIGAIIICDSRLNLVSSAFFSCQQALTGNSGFWQFLLACNWLHPHCAIKCHVC